MIKNLDLYVHIFMVLATIAFAFVGVVTGDLLLILLCSAAGIWFSIALAAMVYLGRRDRGSKK